MYNTDGWSRVEKNFRFFCEGHSKADCYREVIDWIIDHPATAFADFEEEWVDGDEWDDRF